MTEILSTDVKARDWTLEIQSFKGIVPGAVHFMGYIQRDVYRKIPNEHAWYWFHQRVRLEHPLTSEEIRSMPKDDREFWDAGDWQGRFWSEEDVIVAALAVFPLVADEGDWLIHNEGYDDERTLVGTEDPDYDLVLTGGFRCGAGTPKNAEIDMSEVLERDRS